MNGRRLRRAMIHLSIGASLALVATLVLLSSGGGVSMAQISVSPSCALIDPVTGLCETVTSILSPTSTTTTIAPTTTTTTTAPTTTTTTTSSTTTTSGGTSSTSTGGSRTSTKASNLATAPFGSSAYGPGGLFSAYTGNFGGGTTYFAPTAQTQTSRQVYFQSAFGAPVSKEVATAAVDLSTIQAAPLASAATQVPRIMLLLVPMGLLMLMLVTSLVLEVNEGGAGTRTLTCPA
jgi:hypothetical protein